MLPLRQITIIKTVVVTAYMYLRPSRYHSKGSSLFGFSSISIGDFVENFGGSGGRLDWHKCDLKSCLDDVKRPFDV